MENTKLLILDCDGTCYSKITGLNDVFGKALFQVAEDLGYSQSEALKLGASIRAEHPGMMNFLLAIANDKQNSFSEVAHLWCHKLNYNLIQPNPELARALSQVSIQKCVFTNNCFEHVNHVWDRLFPDNKPDIKIYSIEKTAENGWFYPKQTPEGLKRICAKENVSPAESCLMDDTPAILKIAEQNGLQTRLISEQNPICSCLREFIRE